MRLLTLVFDRWNLGTSDVYVRDNAEVDATGVVYATIR